MRPDDDIREIFRRAFEQQGQPDPGEPGSPPPGSPRTPPRPQMPVLPPDWWRSRTLWASLLVLVIFLSFRTLITTWTEWLWFTETGYTSVWLRTLLVRVGSFVAAFLIALAVLGLNLQIALKTALSHAASQFAPGRFAGFRVLMWGAALVLSWMFAGVAHANRDGIMRWLFRATDETLDPVFGRNLTFYFFELPFYDFLRGWLVTLLFFTLIGVLAIHAAHNIEMIRRGGWQPQKLVPLRKHIAILAGLMALLMALGHWFGRYDLLFSRNGFVHGIGHTDFTITARVYVLSALLMVGVAATLFWNVFRLELRSVLVLGALWLFSTFVLGGIVPSLYQAYSVTPNEFSRELPYIRHSITATRSAYGLDKVEMRDFGEVKELTNQDLADNALALQNIRLWDYRVLPLNYRQLQSLRNYYDFSDIDIDRYEIDGQMRQVMLAGRELNKSQLPATTWVNQKLNYTHGYGVVMNPVDRFTPDGQPEFILGGIPAESRSSIQLTRPQIYYGERMNDVVYANSAQPEIDYVFQGQEVTYRYSGEGGVPAGNLLRRLAFAFRFADINLILSNEITPDTRIMFHRQIVDRVRHIAPFLTIDYDPYLVVTEDGHLVWIVDGYTTSRRYPYSEPLMLANDTTVRRSGLDTRANYVRNVVKITVDAYDGTVRFYQIDDQDPLVRTWARAYPELFRPISDMPEALQRHLRYPETLFRIQSSQYTRYHMTDPAIFYNQGDLWALPQLGGGTTLPMEPYYVIFRLPGERDTEYLLIQPYTPSNRNNMMAWIAARNDMPHYGELVVYKWQDSNVLGPLQIEGRIDQDPQISEQVTLWGQSGSEVIRGNLLVIPLNNSFLYVEPLYLQATTATNALPELKRVIVASRNNVVMRETLAEALAALVRTSVASVVEGADLVAPTDGNGDSGPLTPLDATVDELIRQANSHFEAAEAAQRDGDWTTYGRELENLQTVLGRLLSLIEE